jgi:hypothetical protein
MNNDLIQKITDLRKQLNSLLLSDNDLKDPEILNLSRELDKLLAKYLKGQLSEKSDE